MVFVFRSEAVAACCCCGSPLIFYVLSIAYGGVPIYLPPWWPFSLYNARYGLELLPAFAVFAALLLHFLLALRTGPLDETAVGCRHRSD